MHREGATVRYPTSKEAPTLADNAPRAEPWVAELAALIAGPYAGHGGLGDLAKDLGLSRAGLDHYRAGRRDPMRQSRLKIRALYEQHGLNETGKP